MKERVNDKMKKYNLLFKLSFITYVMFMIAMPYITAQIWADLIMVLFISSVIYQFVYLFGLRKKDNKKFSEILVLFLIYGITSLSVRMIIDYIDVFINGYTPTDFVGNRLGYTYYGIQAILENQIKNILYVPYIIINTIILIIYNCKKDRSKNKGVTI